jgi:hypothetical protein
LVVNYQLLSGDRLDLAGIFEWKNSPLVKSKVENNYQKTIG